MCLRNSIILYEPVYDSSNHLNLTVIPFEQENFPSMQIPWAQIFKNDVQIGVQTLDNPYLTLLWIKTAQDEKKRRQDKTISILKTVTQNQNGFAGSATYELNIIDALLPKQPFQTMDEILIKHDARRVTVTTSMVFEEYVPIPTTIVNTVQYFNSNN